MKLEISIRRTPRTAGGVATFDVRSFTVSDRSSLPQILRDVAKSIQAPRSVLREIREITVNICRD